MSLPQYMITDLPQYVHITDRSKFQNSIVQSDAALIFSQDGTSLTVKLPSGVFQNICTGSGEDMSDSAYQRIMDIIGVSDSSVYAQSDSVSVGASIIQISPNGTGSIKIVQSSGPVTVTFDQYTAQQFTSFPVTIAVTSDTTSIKIQGDVLSLDCSTVPLVALDVSNHTTLQILNVNSCGLSTLTVTGCSQLTQILATENSLTSLTLTGTPINHLTISENSLPASVMDQILIYLNALDTLGGAAYMTDQTTGAVPTAAGYTAKSQLQSRGWTVQVGSQG